MSDTKLTCIYADRHGCGDREARPYICSGGPVCDLHKPGAVTPTTHTKEDAAANTTWFVIADVCDCNKIGITVMDAARVQDAGASKDEAVATGHDWRQLVTETATEMHRRTGLKPSGTCSVADRADDLAFVNELAAHVYRVADLLDLEQALV